MTDWGHYKKQHPFCEVCYLPADEVHHIVPRGTKGLQLWDNSPQNLISLCAEHHAEAHVIGQRLFPEKYGLQERWQKAREKKND